MKMLERVFKINELGSTYKTEILAGVTTFMTMSYIIFVNPAIIAKTGMPFDAVMVATCLSAAIATIMMGLYANYPIGLAPSMGINAFFTYGLVFTMGFTWEVALAAIFIEGIFFIIITFANIRELILDTIPLSLKVGIPVGIGLFLIFIGLQNGGIVVKNDATLITLGNVKKIETALALLGFIIISVLYIKKIRGSILISIIAVTILGIIFGVTPLPNGIVSLPPSIAPIFMKMDFSMITNLDFIIVVLVLLFMDIFNTVGTLLGVASRTGMLDKNGNLPRAKEAFMADAVGTTAGAMLGVSTVTAYIESATGVEEGGRTGLVAVVVGLLFLLAIFFTPLVAIVPGFATAPALIFVGILMMCVIKELDFNDWSESIPAIVTVFIMPFTYNIATGIEFGVIAYVLIKVLVGKYKSVSKIMYVLAILFILKEILI